MIMLALAASIFSFVMYYYSLKGYSDTLKYARLSFYISTIFIIAASALLMHSILTHDYSIKYVYEYSNSDLSLGMLMSTFWAGQEGSFLLWTFFTAILGIMLISYLEKNKEYESAVMVVYSGTLAFLIAMVSPLLKNPFEYIWTEPTFVDAASINHSLLGLEFLKGFIFADNSTNKTFLKISNELVAMLNSNGVAFSDFLVKGKGLNPLLQNFWMQIHPPVLFVGFAFATIPYAFSLGALIKNKYDKWLELAMPWSLWGIMFLGSAIMLGGYWAYGILGWGGYWAWDPVENASLVPWLIWVAVLHTVLIQIKTQKEGKPMFVKTNLILNALVYVFVIYSTFLTRSGVLQESSVHSFVAPGRFVFVFLVIFILLIVLIPFVLYYFRRNEFKKEVNKIENNYSREMSLFLGAVLLIASAVIVSVGTSFPLIGGAAVQPSFYDNMHIPLIIVLMIINGISVFTVWKTGMLNNLLKSVSLILGISLLVSLVIFFVAEIKRIDYLLILISSFFTIISNLFVMFKIHSKVKLWGAFVSHLGIGIFFIGVIASGGFSEQKHSDLALNEPQEILGHKVTFIGYENITGTEKYAFNISVEKDGKKDILKPVMFFSSFNNSLMREPDLLEGIVKDFYISPVSFTTTQDQQSGNELILEKNKEVTFRDLKIKFEEFNFPESFMESMQGGKDFFIGAKIKLSKEDADYFVETKMKVTDGKQEFSEEKIEKLGLTVKMLSMDATGTVKIALQFDNEKESVSQKDIFTAEISTKPFMSLIWTGVVLMMLGFIISAFRRKNENE